MVRHQLRAISHSCCSIASSMSSKYRARPPASTIPASQEARSSSIL
ncbi:hypothetical protein RB2654_14030 [Rhodobacterales bacterium HTCC2654]|uniref:Uncharacterized protein n=1 Tax=Maritimibacter alkaliphilus HTCC2654 TaxID=314271 RepID=A3VGK5_9RHOB|nr:hypothetical protein RB2654_14030 [Rhodobacterales bacterium HTCC2654] [Maritimibacter alkaliphilus HTCC2654]